MDTLKLLALGYALQLKPTTAEQAIEYAEELHEWLCDGADEDMEVLFTPEGTNH